MDYDQAAPLALITELRTLEQLAQADRLNDAGLHWAFHWLNHANQLMPGNPAIVRERVLAVVIAALVRATGMPATYWTDRTALDVPDDPSGLA